MAITNTTPVTVTVKIIPHATGDPTGKLADAELLFTDGVLAGLTLIGFSIWVGRPSGRRVTFPARQYTVNGERRSFTLLRPSSDRDASHALRELILQAYRETDANQDAGAAAE